MAEDSHFWQTGTSGDGTSPISQDRTTRFFGAVFTRGGVTSTAPATAAGVFPGVGNELAVTAGAGQVQVATGMAMDAGFAYINDSALNIAVPTPVSNTRIDRIVLRASFAARTVRLTRIAGTEGVGTPPALTQVAGTTWDIPIANASVTTGGAITVSDQRTFNRFATRLDRSDIAGGTATRVPFFDASGRLTDDAGFAYESAAQRVNIGGPAIGGRLSLRGAGTKAGGSFEVLAVFGTSDATSPARTYIGVVPGGTPYFILDGVDDSTYYPLVLGNPAGSNKIGVKKIPAYDFDVAGQVGISPTSAAPPLVLGANGQDQRVSKLRADAISTLRVNRQGGSGTSWGASGSGTAGTTNYLGAVLGQARLQVGAIGVTWPGGTQLSNTVTVTFPEAFSQPPVIVCTGVRLTAGVPIDGLPYITAVSASQFTVQLWSPGGAVGAGQATTMNWAAIGPE